MNYIVRAVFNRPEMFYLSILSEIEAREYFTNSEYKTLFCVEHGAPPIITEIIEKAYPFEKEIVHRPFRHFGWANILEGFKYTFNLTDNYVLNFEDDCIIHKTYFKYIDAVQKLIDNKCAVINSSNRSDPNRKVDDVVTVKRTRRFEATCCLIYKYFFDKYVKQYATPAYYSNRQAIINKVNDRNGDDPRSKYRPSRGNLNMHIGWDGLVNRLVDTAAIEEGMYVISPESDRRVHIGFYGQNRPGGFPSNETDFNKRVALLVDIVKSADNMSKLDGRYKDYALFSKELDSWSGEINLI